MQQLMLNLSDRIPIKILLIGIMEHIPSLTLQGKLSALKAYTMILLQHGKGTGIYNPVFEEDRDFLLS